MNDPTTQPTEPRISQEDEVDLREIWEIIRRNRWLILGIVGAFLAAAVAYFVFTMPVWEATASLRIEQQSETEMPSALTMLSSLSGGSEVETEMQALRSRTLAAEVVEELNLGLVVLEPDIADRRQLIAAAEIGRTTHEREYLLTRVSENEFAVINSYTDAELGTYGIGDRILLDGSWIILTRAAAREPAIELLIYPFQGSVALLKESIGIGRPNMDANFVTVRFESTDTFLVQAVPNVLAKSFIQRHEGVRRSEAQGTVVFLKEQLDTMRRQLTTAENQLRVFRETEGVIAAEAQATGQVERLIGLQARRSKLAAERNALAGLLKEVEAEAAASRREPGEESPYRRLMAFPTIFRNQAASQLLRTLAELENQRAVLLQVQTFSHPDVIEITQRIHDLEAQLRTTAVTYLGGLTEEIAAIESSLDGFQQKLAAIPAKQVELARLVRQTEILGEIYILLQKRLKEAQIAAAVENPNIRVVDPAIQSIDPIRPRPVLTLILALLLGATTGVSIAFTREYLDTTVHTQEDVKKITGLPVLGLIPEIEFSKNGDGLTRRVMHIGRNGHRARPASVAAHLVTGHDPLNPVSESYRTLRTNITFSDPNRTIKTLLCTSALPGEGKTTTACNLAITMAEQGRRVLLVDADLRRGVLSDVFDVAREPGLLNVLFRKKGLEDTVHQLSISDDSTLEILTTGTLPSNPAELLGSESTRSLIEQLESRYDRVIFDAPPLNLVTDAAVLGRNADGVIVIARADITERPALAHAVQELKYVRAPLVGVILNNVSYDRLGYYGKYGSDGYFA